MVNSKAPRADDDAEDDEDGVQLAEMLRKCRPLEMSVADAYEVIPADDDTMPEDDELEVRHILTGFIFSSILDWLLSRLCWMCSRSACGVRVVTLMVTVNDCGSLTIK